MSGLAEETLIALKNDDTGNSAVFEAILGKTLTLNQGDYLTLQQAFLRTGSSSGLFNFPEPVDVSIECGYWEQYDNSTANNATPDSDRDTGVIAIWYPPEQMYNMMILCNMTEPYSGANPWQFDSYYYNTFTFTIPAGTYSGPALADLMSLKLQTLTLQGDTYLPSNNLMTSTKEVGCNNTDATTGFALFNEGGTYNAPGQPANNGYIYTVDYVVVGSSNLAIIYDAENNRFSFTYLHIPCMDANKNQVVQIYQQHDDATPTNYFGYAIKTAVSGVFLHDLQPASFWNQLGMFPQNVCYRPFPPYNDPPEQFYNSITTQFASLSMMDTINLSQFLYGGATPTWPIVVASNNTVRVNGSYLGLTDTDGFFLMQIEFGHVRNTLISDINNSSAGYIMSVCSMNWIDAHGTVTIYDNSAIVYQHRDENPLNITHVKIRLLDRDYVETTFIDVGSTIFLTISNALVLGPVDPATPAPQKTAKKSVNAPAKAVSSIVPISKTRISEL